MKKNEIAIIDRMKEMQEEMDDMFERFFESPSGHEMTVLGPKAPLADLEDRGDTYVLTADLPGVKKKDINIEITENSLRLRAEKSSEKEEKDKDYYYHERTYSGYNRTFALPESVNPDRAKADYKDGILTVRMKKAALPPPKKKQLKLE